MQLLGSQFTHTAALAGNDESSEEDESESGGESSST